MPNSAVSITVSPASVIISAIITYPSEDAAAAAASTIAAQLGDAGTASSLLGITVQTAPVVAATVVMEEAPFVAPPMPVGVVAGPLAGVVLLLMCATAVLYVRRAAEPPTRVLPVAEGKRIEMTDVHVDT